MPPYIYFNGKIMPADEMKIETTNRSFRYGDGLFETIRMINGKMPLFNRHVNRLFEGMEVLKLKAPDHWNPEYIKEKITEVSRKCGNEKNARIRLMVYRSGKGHYLPSKNEAEILIESLSLDVDKFPLNEKGIVVDIFPDMEKTLTRISNYKTNNCLLYVMASIYKTENNLDDCLIVNAKNRVIEGISSNIFLIKNNEVYTTPLTEGCVAGVMRATLFDLLVEKGIQVHQTPQTLEDLFTADELFLTDSVKGIRWAGSYKNHKFKNTVTTKIAGMLNEHLISMI